MGAPVLGAGDPITKLLEAMPPPDQLYFFALVEAVYRSRYTGATLIHWKNGLPKQIDLGSPVRLSIVQPLDSGDCDPAG